MKLFSVVCFYLLLSYTQLSGQHYAIDSLQNLIAHDHEDSSKVRHLKTLAFLVLNNNPDSAIQLGQQAYQLAEKMQWKLGMAASLYDLGYSNCFVGNFEDARAYTTKAISFYEELKDNNGKSQALITLARIGLTQGDYQEALSYCFESLKIKESMHDEKGIADVRQCIGIGYFYSGDYPKALENWQQALSFFEKSGNSDGIESNLTNIGNVYSAMKNPVKALEYYQKANSMIERTNNKFALAQNYGLIGARYYDMLEDDAALVYAKKSLALNQELGNQNGIAWNFESIGNVYSVLKEYDLALDYFHQALTLCENQDDKNHSSSILGSIGSIYQSKGNLSEALKYKTKSLEMAKQIGSLERIMTAYGNLTVLDSAMHNFEDAYEHYKLYKEYEDSIYNMENAQKLTSLQMQYDFDKKETATQAEQEKKDAIALEEMQKQKLVRNGFIGGFALVLGFALVFFGQRNRIKRGKKRSDELLLNILPEEVAEELKAKGSADAQLFDEVTVLFTDFKGFTQLSEKLQPKELVDEIHECFSAFDHIMQRHGIEKIKTIGDSYMAAGGLPTANHTHAEDVVNAAIEIQQFMREHKITREKAGELFFEIRIGVHTGSVVAGIVGVKKFAYDIWGDTVNTASRMESSGEIGQINISGTTYALIKDKFKCLHRGKIAAKGKGEIDMYFVETTVNAE